MFTLGCDPEFFLKDSKGNFVPAFDTLGGTKAEPRILECGHTVQEDGCALEIGIRPASTAEEFAQYVREAMTEVGKLLKPLKLHVAIEPEVTFTAEQLMNPKGWEVGCDPDYDAYTSAMRVMKDYTDYTRYAGGHIHIGNDELLNPKVAADYIKALDVTIGYRLARLDKLHNRAKVYGGPGKFRYKPYGVEYRTPSNGWLKSHDRQVQIFSVCERVLYQVAGGSKLHRYAVQSYPGLVEAMQTGKRNILLEQISAEYTI